MRDEVVVVVVDDVVVAVDATLETVESRVRICYTGNELSLLTERSCAVRCSKCGMTVESHATASHDRRQ